MSLRIFTHEDIHPRLIIVDTVHLCMLIQGSTIEDIGPWHSYTVDEYIEAMDTMDMPMYGWIELPPVHDPYAQV